MSLLDQLFFSLGSPAGDVIHDDEFPDHDVVSILAVQNVEGVYLLWSAQSLV